MKTTRELPLRSITSAGVPLPPGPKGNLILGVMSEFNRDMLGFIDNVKREYGDIAWMRFLYVPAIFLYHPDDIQYVLGTNPRNFKKAMTLRSTSSNVWSATVC